MMKAKFLILFSMLSFVLSGCVVGAVADLAATTVVTAGKVAVKGTGALVRAAIPDDDEDESKEDKKKPKKEVPVSDNRQASAASGYVPVQNQSANPPPARPATVRHITIDENGNTYETAAPQTGGTGSQYP